MSEPRTPQLWLKAAIEEGAPQHDSTWLMCHLLGCKPQHLSQLTSLSNEILAQFQAGIRRLKKLEPLAYIISEEQFWTHTLKVTPAVLVPRPETEVLVEWLLTTFNHEPRSVLELGTGSGAIALSLKKERPTWQIIASDLFWSALQIAQINAQTLNLPLNFIAMDWLKALKKSTKFDIIVSNPPYVSATYPHLACLSHEPYQALVSGDAGLDALVHIIEQAPAHLNVNGSLWLEHGFDQASSIEAQMKQAGFEGVLTRADFAGHLRYTRGYFPG